MSAVRRSDDSGSALALALVFLMIFGVYIGVVLQFAATGHRTTTSVRDEATSTYAGGGAIDGAINAVRAATAIGVDPGTAVPPAASSCFTLPTGQLDNPTPIDVTCQPRQGSGGDPPAALLSQPAQAVLARSTNAAEGVSLTAGPFSAQGRVQVKQGLRLTGSATLSSTGANAAVQAGNCTGATTSPACVTTTSIPGDPGWAAPTEYPAMGQTVPACGAQNRVVTLSPGTYLDATALQNAMDNCSANSVIWFQPGTYYLDFRDTLATERELDIPAGSVVVGGAPLGWIPGSSAPNQVPVPTAAIPARSACDVSKAGVQLIFAGDSRMNVESGADIQLCAEETGTTAQHIVLRGLATQTAALPAAQPTTGEASTSANSGTGTAWTNPAEGAVIDDDIAYVIAARNTTSRALRVGRFPTNLVPPEATNIEVTVSLTGAMIGPGATNVRLTNGTTVLTSTPLRTCPVAGCNDTALRTDSVTISGAGLTAAFVNLMYVDALVSSRDVGTPNGGATTGVVDGITVSVDFSAPMRATSGTGIGSPYVRTQTSTTPILRTAGSFPGTIVALHGTVDAQVAAVDLGTTLVPFTVIDRGVAVRHLQSSMSRAATYTGPLISVPDLPQGPRRVLLVARDTSSAVLARADVVFANTAGTANGNVPTVTEWSVN
jgi:hypothetical protein